MSASAGHERNTTPRQRALEVDVRPGRARRVFVEFDSADDARGGRDKLLSSGVLDRFEDKTDPKVLEEAEQVSY